MRLRNADDITRILADGLRESLCSFTPELVPRLLRLLAEGRPVSAAQVATVLRIPPDEAAAALRQLPSVEFDHEGNVVGSGLTLTPTPHHFRVNGRELFAWCALDTLFFPVILKQPADVQSLCPVTGVEVRLTVTPEGVERLDPAGAVVSIVIPEAAEACRDIRRVFCNLVHFFSSREAASAWLAEHPGAIILSVTDAYQVGCGVTEQLFTESANV